jgi:Tol biopolymer transport system component
MLTRKIAALYLLGVCAMSVTVAQTGGGPYQVLFNRFQVPVVTLYSADADGKRERPLLASPGLDYAPSYSSDGKWIVFTSERAGQADIYRVRSDGTGLEQLTNHPAFDDQAALSPDGKTLRLCRRAMAVSRICG